MHPWLVEDRHDPLEVVDGDWLVDRVGESSSFCATELLIGHKGDRRGVVGGDTGEVVEKLLLDRREVLLRAGEVDGQHPPLPVALAKRIGPSVLPAERMARIDLLEPLVLEDLSAEAFRRPLPAGPVP